MEKPIVTGPLKVRVSGNFNQMSIPRDATHKQTPFGGQTLYYRRVTSQVWNKATETYQDLVFWDKWDDLKQVWIQEDSSFKGEGLWRIE